MEQHAREHRGIAELPGGVEARGELRLGLGKFTGLPSAAVGGLDLGQFRTSSGEDRRFDTCGTVSGSRPCAIFDVDEAAAGNAIGGLDLGRFRQLSGSTPGPRCASCTGTGSAPLPCTAGTAGTCF